ncbi:hypothetical protein ACIA8O_34915 [Kitasatospora sp. NPDC051853]|uniref:hypothetical protein n=1 Tax=Kitasatospora sp. NPDC051853 TaxID=3364058 RepID=UPI0037A938CA
MTPPLIADDTALLALGSGHRLMSGLAVTGGRLTVPVGCLIDADRQRDGIADHVGALSGITFEEVGLTAARPLAELMRDGLGLGTAHAVYAARPSLSWPAGRAVLTTSAGLYKGRGVRVVTV